MFRIDGRTVKASVAVNLFTGFVNLNKDRTDKNN